MLTIADDLYMVLCRRLRNIVGILISFIQIRTVSALQLIECMQALKSGKRWRLSLVGRFTLLPNETDSEFDVGKGFYGIIYRMDPFGIVRAPVIQKF
jgi:hypothetical protein